MKGVGLPLVTPFDADEEIDEGKLRSLVSWVIDRGVDFIVPCGSNSEAELMTFEERTRVVEIVAEESTVPVVAGTGHPGYRETREGTARAAAAGASAALVVTPFYYRHEQEAIEAYYRDLADASEIPIYLYDVSKYTGVSIDPGTVGSLSSHRNVHGIKDSSGDLGNFHLIRRQATEDFESFVGSGGVFAHGLDAGAAGGILALANLAPAEASGIYRRHRDGDERGARELNRRLVALNHAITAEYGVPGLKAAMRARGLPAGRVRQPHQPVDERTISELEELMGPLEDG
jgi:4-hydroxy-tetrahydrodipicolinate synthase